MTDDDLDHRLREALSEAPSADLVARVRAQLDAVPSHTSVWHWSAVVVPGVLATAAVAAIAFVSLPARHDGPPVALRPTERADVLPPAPTLPTPVDSSEVRTRRAWPPVSPRSAATVPQGAAPAPVFAPGEAQAFELLLAFSRSAWSTAGAEPATVVMADDVTPLPPLAIPPMAVPPLVLADAIVEGGPQ